MSVVGGRALQKRQLHDPKHILTWGWLPGPDFKLARRLVNEHFAAWYDFCASWRWQLQQAGFRRVIDHIKDVSGFDFLGIKGRFPMVSHGSGGGVDNDITA